MPHTDYIGKVLNIKDPNVYFYDDAIIKGVLHKIFKAKLTYQPKACHKCGHVMDKNIIKHGFKASNITLASISGFNAKLKLKSLKKT